MIPINEFDRFEQIFVPGDGVRPSASDIAEAFDRISLAWENAAFSELPDHSICRYFHYQLEGISKLSDTIYHDPNAENTGYLQTQLLELIDRLFRYHLRETNTSTNAPIAFHLRLILEFKEVYHVWISKINAAPVSPALKGCLTDWLKSTLKDQAELHFSFRYLNYFKKLSVKLFSLDFGQPELEESIVTLLSQYNFNHLSFLIYRQQVVRRKLAGFAHPLHRLSYLQAQQAEILGLPEIMQERYDLSWPSHKIMLAEWLQEQITLAKLEQSVASREKPVVVVEKQLMDISVAHLACFIKLFLEENVLASQNTKSVIHFFSSHFRTKKQTAISAGSLSKEFYSIDQHTAARVRDILQKMVQRINRNFFPVVAVIGTAALAYPGIN